MNPDKSGTEEQDGAEAPVNFQYGDILELDVDRAAFEGRAVGRAHGLVVFVEGAVPGDRVRARVFRAKKQFVEARAVEILRPSPERVDPRCAHFGVCGGCSWQHMRYEAQAAWKRTHVADAFERIGGFQNLDVRATLEAEDVWYYRNKMEYSFGEKRWLLAVDREQDTPSEPFAVGLHVPGRYDKILHIDACHLQSPESNSILAATRSHYRAHGIRAFSTETHSGDLRHLVIREAKNTGQRMVFLVTSGANEDLAAELARILAAPEFGVTTFVHGVTNRKSSVAIADREQVYFGDGRITERLGDCTYFISPSSFFQSNTRQAERLYACAADFADLRPEDDVWDLYCGAGTISLFIAPRVRSVLGVEMNEAAVRDAIDNAARNGRQNTRFIAADLRAFIQDTGREAAPDVVILDPPRSGLHPDVAAALARLDTERLVYVSCNPATAARDCAVLAAGGYTVEAIAPVDMFPHTYHIECVIRLRRKTGA
ncbi:MAG: 23S rRNA (uracil(1939)-C(5))-methyltransferase RlmD [Ignavibacteriae bacterium]|nr:23S rRNA (uracil(1939)-C(5))-methyltransferase RlmD [Ignavibacteriota bacterium]